MKRNPRKFRAVVGAVRRRGKQLAKARVGKKTVRIYKNRRRRNAPAHGKVTLVLRSFQGEADHVGYKHAGDRKLYKHDFEIPTAAHVYFAESPHFGKAIVIMDPEGITPLWGR